MYYKIMKKRLIAMLFSLLIIISVSLISEHYVEANENAENEEIQIRRGDVNKDGSVNAKDALVILRIAAQIEDGDANIADVNDDGKISARDALMVLKHVVGLLPKESVDFYANDTNVLKVGSVTANVPNVVYIRTYEEYAEYIARYMNHYPGSFDGKADEVLGLYTEAFFSSYDLVGININNYNWADSVYSVDDLYSDGFTYGVDINSYVPEGTESGYSVWCVLVAVGKSDEISGRMKVNVSEEVELLADTDGEIGTWSKLDAAAFSQGVDIISDYNTYKDFLNKYFYEADVNYMDIYSEEFFTDNVLLAVRYEASSISYYDVIPEKITKADGAYKIYMESLSPMGQLAAIGNWVSFIPTSIKDWSEGEFTFERKSYGVYGMADSMEDAEACTYKTGGVFDSEVTVISTYKEYIEYMSKIRVRLESISDQLPSGYSEEFFENNSLLIVEHDEHRSSMIDISYDSMEVVDDTCEIKLIAFVPEEGTDDCEYWGIMVPVEGKDWIDKSYTVTKTDMILNE